jgi:hypothetical protein
MKEKDYIEELIRENLDGLNDFEPAEGHFDRFEAKLKAQSKRKKLNFGIVWKVAAIVIFVVLAANQAYIYFAPANKNGLNENNGNTGITLSSVSQDYGEVEFYYNTAINTGLSQWNNMKEDGLISATEQEAMNTELAEFEERFKTLQADLAANPNDERVINAMLEYYKAKLDIINMIVNKLEEVKQQKITSHENNI